MSGNTSARTDSATASSTATMPSLSVAAMLECTHGLTRQNVSVRSGHPLISNAVGISIQATISVVLVVWARVPRADRGSPVLPRASLVRRLTAVLPAAILDPPLGL